MSPLESQIFVTPTPVRQSRHPDRHEIIVVAELYPFQFIVLVAEYVCAGYVKTIVSLSRTSFGSRGIGCIGRVHETDNNGEQVEPWIPWLQLGKDVAEGKVVDLVGPSGYFDQACSCPVDLGHRKAQSQSSGFVDFDNLHIDFDQLEVVKAARRTEHHTLHCLHCSEAVCRSLLGC